jgi:hypothetical protein
MKIRNLCNLSQDQSPGKQNDPVVSLSHTFPKEPMSRSYDENKEKVGSDCQGRWWAKLTRRERERSKSFEY